MKFLISKQPPFDSFLTTNARSEQCKSAKLWYQYYPWGSKWYVASTRLPGTVPLFRLVKETHFYTTSTVFRTSDRGVPDDICDPSYDIIGH